MIGLYRAQVIRHEGLWRRVTDVEIATLYWVNRFNHYRVLETLGHYMPAEHVY